MNTRIRLSGLFPSLLLGSALALSLTVEKAVAQDVFKVGVVAPFSGAGAAWGAPAWQGSVLAAEQINSAGGIGGLQIELVQGDDACVPATGVTAAQRLINREGVNVITGAVCSSVTLALMPVAEDAQVLLLNSSSSNPKITHDAGVGGHRYTFRNLGTDESRAAATLQHAVESLGRTKFGILAVDSDFGRDAVNYVKLHAERYEGVEFVSEDYFLPAETDFRSVLTKIKSRGADGIIYYGLVGTSPVLCNQMHELGMGEGAFPLVGSGNFTAEVISQCPPGSLEHTVETVAWVDSLDFPDSKQFTEDYRARWNGETPDSAAYQAWTSLYILRDAVEVAGSIDNEAIITALETTAFSTPMGEIRFDDHHQSDIPQVIIEIIDHERVVQGTIRTQVTYPEQ